MRLLEFNRDTGGANPLSKAAGRPPSKKAARPVKLAKPADNPARTGKSFTLKTGAAAGKSRRPIDLEQLQLRIEVLERRIQARTQDEGEHPASRDLDMLKQRMDRLQQSVHSELWAARQREQAMLAILSKPSFKTAAIAYIKRFRSKQLPIIRHWIMSTAKLRWLDCQPDWWPALAKAWQESLDKARGLPHN